MPKIAKARGRAVEEWIGKTPDSMPPPHVRLRIFERYGGRCYITKTKLQAGDWHLDHIIRLENGGENRESNLAPIYAPKHREKTGQENTQGARERSLRQKQIGIRPKPKHKIPQPAKAARPTAKQDALKRLGPPRLVRETN